MGGGSHLRSVMKQISPTLYEIPPHGAMRVPVRIYADEEILAGMETDETLRQASNVATLPGIVNYALVMPDAHMGYGFPIGGVAAMDYRDGVISPGGVGYDINCGIRLATTRLTAEELRPKTEDLLYTLFRRIPTGVGSSGAIRKLSQADLARVLTEGAGWAVSNGFGDPDDLEAIEEGGSLPNADPGLLSSRAIERGRPQLGTLGSGNHFMEISVVDEIYHEKAARVFGLFVGQVTLSIHSGSRGLGYQVCDDNLALLGKASDHYGIDLPDRQLASVPITSSEGRRYLDAMAAAANYAWANRQILQALAHETILEALSISPAALGLHLLYDIAHNIVKIETHRVGKKKRRLAVHRKGATRAFGPGRKEVPKPYRAMGQPVLLPGDMGTESYVLIGTERAMEETFGSAAHGAGRELSRRQAIRSAKGRDIRGELAGKGIIVLASGKRTLLEERPGAYKEVGRVAEVLDRSGIARKVARLKPLGVIKG